MVTGAAASAAAPGMWRAGAFKLSYYGEYLDVFYLLKPKLPFFKCTKQICGQGPSLIINPFPELYNKFKEIGKKSPISSKMDV